MGEWAGSGGTGGYTRVLALGTWALRRLIYAFTLGEGSALVGPRCHIRLMFLPLGGA